MTHICVCPSHSSRRDPHPVPYTTLFRSVPSRPVRLEAGVNRSIVAGETIAAISTAAGEIAAIVSPATIEQIGEHTSELQSLTNLVCRLLLEKKTLAQSNGSSSSSSVEFA